MNFGNVVKSFFLGVGIGVLLQLGMLFRPGSDASDAGSWAIALAASGMIGLVIGLVTEWLTALLPIRLARTRTYFLINGGIAVVVTAAILLLARTVVGGGFASAEWWSTLGIIVLIVTIANVADYAVYARTNARLRARQAELLRRESGSSNASAQGSQAGRLER